jgi:DNA-binding SARP family transcriptional activator/tetratricopeptide (TPR) repeat protein
VLAVLLLEADRVVPVERIVACAWPTDPPETAPDLVTSYISRLRKAFAVCPEQISLISRRPGYLARIDRSRIDAHQFAELVHLARREREGLDSEHAAAHLRQALALWHGAALADVHSPWLVERRSSLERSKLDAIEELAELDMDAERHDHVLALTRDLAEAHPERERLTVVAIRALDAIGEPRQAVDLASRSIRALRAQGLDPSPALRQAQIDALRPKDQPERARTGPAHAQLPPDTPAFTGRQGELDQLLHLVGDGRATDRVVVCTVEGMPGIGKTAFAIHAARQLAIHFPDGQLFIDLHGFTPGTDPVKPETALDRILRTLGVATQHIPTDPDERAAVYRERLAATRTLLVLDNASSEAQVQPLLPGAPGCLALITSRRRLTALDDAHAIRLEVLSEVDAAALFTIIAGPGRVSATDPALAQIIALCGNIPLALRIAAARLHNRPTWPARHLAVRLHDQAQRMSQLDDGARSLHAAFTVSYEHLTTEEQRLFRQLGMHPGTDFDLYAASALADTAPETADVLLEGLVDHNLLMQPTAGRYQLHDLVRIHARTLARTDSAEDRDRARRRLLNYYLYAARCADQLITRWTMNHTPPIEYTPASTPDFRTDTQAAAWMEAERANLTALVDAAVQHGLTYGAIALPAALHGALRLQGHWVLDQRLQRIALATAQRNGDRQNQANALLCLGDIEAVIGQHIRAADTLMKAQNAYQDAGDRLGQANTLSSLAQVHRLTARFSQAEEDLRNALGIYRALGDGLGQANALTTLGNIHKQTGQYPEAHQSLEDALQLCTRLGHRAGQAEALTDLGEVQQATGQYTEAGRTLRQALDLYQQLGNPLGQATALARLGHIRHLTGKDTAAEQELRQALDLYRRLGHRQGQAETMVFLGAVQHTLRQYPEAADTLKRAISLFQQLDHRLGQADALTAMAAIHQAAGRPWDATECHRRALELYRQIEECL